jgi:hypothetical protein
MTRRDIWRLEVHFWPLALIANEEPYEVCGWIPKQQVGAYRAYAFLFDHPPSKEDFLAVCAVLPWTAVWEDTLLPLLDLKENPWPQVAWVCKAAHTDLTKEGRQIGRIEIDRQRIYQNETHPRPDFPPRG